LEHNAPNFGISSLDTPPVARHLYYFRPGEESRMLARCQFGVNPEGRCGATFTYPIKGYPWRRNVIRSYAFDITPETRELLFDEVHRILVEFPAECLAEDALYSDTAERANGITRDRLTHTLCYTVGIFLKGGKPEDNYSIRESSPALLNSQLYKIVSALIAPYEKL
jgi:hypothetical protein